MHLSLSGKSVLSAGEVFTCEYVTFQQSFHGSTFGIH